MRLLSTCLLPLLLAAPATAETRAYALSGDVSAQWHSDGTVMHPGAASGSMIVSDDGAGTVTLDDFVVRMAFTDVIEEFPGFGITMLLETDTTIRIDTGQTGSGSLRSTVDWGVLTGWTQTGYSFCKCFNCGPQDPCFSFVNFAGTGPPLSLKSSAFLSDTWRFDAFGSFVAMGHRCPGGGAIGPDEPDPTDPSDPAVCQQGSDCPGSCTDGQGNATFPCPCTDTLEILFLKPAPNATIRWHLRFAGNPVPALPLLAVAALGAALVYVGARAVRRRGP